MENNIVVNVNNETTEKELYKRRISTLKDIIKQRVEVSQGIRKNIHESSGMDRHHFWCDKQNHGDITRVHLLIYGFLRGIPYKTIEPKTDRHPLSFYPIRIYVVKDYKGLNHKHFSQFLSDGEFENFREWLKAE